MGKQTFDYISLKPIADRFREVAKTISDYEIRDIIKAQIAEKVKEQLDSETFLLEEIVKDWFFDETHVDWVNKTLKDSIESKLLDKKFR